MLISLWIPANWMCFVQSIYFVEVQSRSKCIAHVSCAPAQLWALDVELWMCREHVSRTSLYCRFMRVTQTFSAQSIGDRSSANDIAHVSCARVLLSFGSNIATDLLVCERRKHSRLERSIMLHACRSNYAPAAEITTWGGPQNRLFRCGLSSDYLWEFNKKK